ncbi:MAG TPA: FAD-dependent oxidoreductase [Symbiobacteriaceae bacterium]|nr:FAD-dependent oxidoreductase [Symbiobacteriaceae bacterium]
MSMRNADVVVIGAGPAGIGAATVAARHGLSVVVLDEHPAPGGRLLGQLHELPGHGADRWWRGAQVAADMVAEARQAGVEIVTGAAVWGIRPEWEVLVNGAPFEAVQAPRVLIATGAVEKSVPIPGWTLPGVITAGAGQVFVNVHRVRPGRKAMLVGVNVLTLTIARELAMAGIEVAGIVLPPPGLLAGDSGNPTRVIASLGRMAGLAPSALLRLAGKVFRGREALGAALFPKGGVKVWGIPLMLRQAAVEVLGDSQVTGVMLEEIGPGGERTGRRRTVELDLVCISDGLSPLAELAVPTGCRFANIPELGGRVPLHGPDMQTTAPGVFVAGNITGIEGATIAMAQGRVAGYGLAAHAGRFDLNAAAFREVRAALDEARSGSAIMFMPNLHQGLQAAEKAWLGI